MATMHDDQMNGAKDAYEAEMEILDANAEKLSDLADKAIVVASEAIKAVDALQKVKDDLERLFKTAADLRVRDTMEPAKTDMLRLWGNTLDQLTHGLISVAGVK